MSLSFDICDLQVLLSLSTVLIVAVIAAVVVAVVGSGGR